MINIFDVPYRIIAAEYHKGKLFLSKRDTTTIIDVTTRKNVVLSHDGINFDYFIDASGDLLGVGHLPAHALYSIDSEFEVCQLLQDGGTNPKWAKMEDGIGARILFLGGTYGLCLEAGDIDGIKGNCIYFIWFNCEKGGDDIARYDFDNKKTEIIPTPNAFGGTWFVPSLC